MECALEHYDPWGLNLAGIERQGSPDHKFQYNGIEKQVDLGLNVLMAKYRTLDPQLGRWWQVDPMVEEFYDLTPYNSNLNNPIRYDDPDGDCPDCIFQLVQLYTKYSAIAQKAHAPAQRLLSNKSGSTPSNINMGESTRRIIKVVGVSQDAVKVAETGKELGREAVIDAANVADAGGEALADGGLLAAPFTKGASLSLIPVGEGISATAKMTKATMYTANGDYNKALEEASNVAVGAVTNKLTGAAINQSKRVGNITNSKQEVTQETALGTISTMFNKIYSKTVEYFNEEK
ncbi:hypothetical protein H7F15_16040 [Pontibacter sp. Tf4]|uniref:RHS repeat domain-containing protein n=1 Tax=Pontibacter sp. Tf4 TaxID=2761620 RepID=UPI0016298784|nr:RHS repeat-associated core domain-containing protein [Pontibacter sp. Tf4]MBB6612556.1 hypothetical protein [Pontibacter sp. Tf4]